MRMFTAQDEDFIVTLDFDEHSRRYTVTCKGESHTLLISEKTFDNFTEAVAQFLLAQLAECQALASDIENLRLNELFRILDRFK